MNWLVKLNNACVPAVDFKTADGFLKDTQFWYSAMVATKDNVPVGVVILIREGAEYKSRNYNWHNTNNVRHLYVDRIIISEDARGLGIGKLLYDYAISEARTQNIPLTAEVNTQPDNPSSHAFHLALGFDAIGQIEHESGYAVRFYRKS